MELEESVVEQTEPKALFEVLWEPFRAQKDDSTAIDQLNDDVQQFPIQDHNNMSKMKLRNTT